MTNREELIEAVLDRICMAPTQKAAARPIVANGLDAALAYLATKGWKITGPEATDGMRYAGDNEDDVWERPAHAETHWKAMHAAAPDLLAEEADAQG
jgi:hypothetical protein